MCVIQNDLGGWWKSMIDSSLHPLPQFWIQEVWGGVPDFLTISQGKLMWLVQESPFENHCWGISLRETKEVNTDRKKIFGKIFKRLHVLGSSFICLSIHPKMACSAFLMLKCQSGNQITRPQKIKDLCGPRVSSKFVCSSCALETDFSHQMMSCRPGGFRALLLLAPLRPLRRKKMGTRDSRPRRPPVVQRAPANIFLSLQ